MKNFIRLFSLCGVSLFAMDRDISSLIPLKKKIEPIIYTIFDSAKANELYRPYKEIIPSSLMITPNEKGVVIAEQRQVRYLDFEKYSSEILFQHPNVKDAPLLALPKGKKECPLLIVSAGNYYHRETKKCVSEYIIYREGIGFKVNQLNWPIQALSFNADGNLLALAGQDQITIFDLEHNTCDTIRCRSKENLLADVTFNSNSSKILFVGNNGMINLADVSRMSYIIDISPIKEAATGHIIKKIHYSTDQEFLYLASNDLTDTGKVKIVDMYDFLNNSHVDIPAFGKTISIEMLRKTPEGKDEVISYMPDSVKGGNVKTQDFPGSCGYDKVVVDQGLDFSIACWNKNAQEKGANCFQVNIYTKEKDVIKKISLDIPKLQERYAYTENNKTCTIGTQKILDVVLRGLCVLVLLRNGKMCKFDLSDYLDIRETKNERILRRRSKTFSGRDLAWLQTEIANNTEKTIDNLRSVPEEIIQSVEDGNKKKNSLSNSFHKEGRRRTSASAPDKNLPAHSDGINSLDSLKEKKKQLTLSLPGEKANIPSDDSKYSDLFSKKQKKPSPRIDALKKLSPKSSRDNSPISSPKAKDYSSSPHRSTRRNSADTKNQSDTIEKM